MTTDLDTTELGPTPSQTVGPFFHDALPWADGPDVVAADHPGAIRIHGVVSDGNGDPVADALIETWQSDVDGRFNHHDDPRGARLTGFRGFGRSATNERGEFAITTLKPGRVPAPQGWQAPHIDVSVFARGLLNRLVTRIYFPEEDAANAADPVLASIEDAAERATLVASAENGGYRFDIRLQGDRETVFFTV